MRTLWRVVTIIIGLIGLVWFGQGIGVIHGSVMTNDSKWAIIGGIMVAVAVIVWFAGARGKRAQ